MGLDFLAVDFQRVGFDLRWGQENPSKADACELEFYRRNTRVQFWPASQPSPIGPPRVSKMRRTPPELAAKCSEQRAQRLDEFGFQGRFFAYLPDDRNCIDFSSGI